MHGMRACLWLTYTHICTYATRYSVWIRSYIYHPIFKSSSSSFCGRLGADGFVWPGRQSVFLRFVGLVSCQLAGFCFGGLKASRWAASNQRCRFMMTNAERQTHTKNGSIHVIYDNGDTQSCHSKWLVHIISNGICVCHITSTALAKPCA